MSPPKKKAYFQKFPLISDGEFQLIWDSRQQVEPGLKARVFVLPDKISPETAAAFKKISPEENWIVNPPSQTAPVASRAQAQLAQDAARIFGEPSRGLRIWGVTGTNGKSSCVEILRHVLLLNGRRVLQVGTLGISEWAPGQWKSAVHMEEVGFTTPLAPQLQWILKRAREEHIDDVVMEVSSHALAEGRADAIHFDCAIFTNLTRDHLDYHGSMNAYFAAKRRLFDELLAASVKTKRVAVINSGAEEGGQLYRSLSAKITAIDFIRGRDVHAVNSSMRGTSFQLKGIGLVESPLIGDHNIENISQVLLALKECAGIAADDMIAAIRSFQGVRGRLQKAQGAKEVFIDYAHTPDALEKALGVLRSVATSKSKIWVVFGCGGDRDPGKRPIMGKIAHEGADCIVLTSDNPRSEDPEKILDQIEAGVPSHEKLKKRDADRKRAIEFALRQMSADDLCLIAGKGHENYQIIGGETRHFSDLETAEELLKSPIISTNGSLT